MNIDVHFYSSAKDLAQSAARRLTLPERATLGEAIEMLFCEIPALRPLGPSCLYAIGTSYARMTADICDGDVVSIIPPVQGG